MEGPLTGVRVLDLTRIVAGPYGTQYLSDLGAEVIKVERPGGEEGRAMEPADRGVSHYFLAVNHGKKGVVIDLGRPEGRQVLLDLAAGCDVVVENFRPGVTARLGIDYPALKAVRGDIILASLSSQGESGPDSGYVSYGTTLEAMSGLSWLTGYAGDAPVASGKDLNYPDQVVAIFAAGMIAAAWFQRQQTGQGAHLDISQRELVSFLAGEAFLDLGVRAHSGHIEHGKLHQASPRCKTSGRPGPPLGPLGGCSAGCAGP